MEAGFRKHGRTPPGEGEAALAVAIALAESGGAPKAHNDKPPDDSYGLWQINMLGSLGPDRRGKLGISHNDELFEPSMNAKAAYMVFREQGWNAWSVYKSGRYTRYIAVARFAVESPRPYDPENDPYIPGPDPDMWSPLDLIKGIGAFIDFITDPQNWLRVAAFILGGLILLFGLVMVARQTGIGKKATNAIPIARVARRMT
jgi:hypothetical protein